MPESLAKRRKCCFFIRFFRPIRNKFVYLQPCPLSKLRCRNEEISINKPNNFLMRMKIKTFMFAALAAFATLFAGCSDDENKTTGGGGNNGTGGDSVKSEYKVTFSTRLITVRLLRSRRLQRMPSPSLLWLWCLRRRS